MRGNRSTAPMFLLGMQFVQALILGITLKVLWGWYMVSTFSLPAINVGQAVGIGLMIEVTARQYVPKTEEPEETVIHGFQDSIVTAIAALVIGGIVHAMIS